ncbi:MAG: MBL fold metallo-hydrolase [Cyclobacteriaceae bacterium]|nr:MBL fold metallo-hydrolase [Cyclobacteriaceae bacterium]
MITIKTFTFNPFLENTYLLYDDSKECIVIDPGCYENHEKEELKDYISSHGLKVVQLLNTHCHIDHVSGNQFIKTTYGVPLSIHKLDEATLNAVPSYASSYGFQHFESSTPDNFLDEGDQVCFGNSCLEIVFVPGHAPGHIAFYNVEQKFCIGGDVLFDGSIGRTDLPGGNHEQLIKSIQSKFFSWEDDMVVYCGHGSTTTIGKEKRSNPFCAVT